MIIITTILQILFVSLLLYHGNEMQTLL